MMPNRNLLMPCGDLLDHFDWTLKDSFLEASISRGQSREEPRQKQKEKRVHESSSDLSSGEKDLSVTPRQAMLLNQPDVIFDQKEEVSGEPQHVMNTNQLEKRRTAVHINRGK